MIKKSTVSKTNTAAETADTTMKDGQSRYRTRFTQKDKVPQIKEIQREKRTQYRETQKTQRVSYDDLSSLYLQHGRDHPIQAFYILFQLLDRKTYRTDI